MAKEKKKIKKSAKANSKLLKNSTLLNAVKALNDSKQPQNVKLGGIPTKTSTANKMRPEKKRG